jgi:hypothetical protein
MQKHKGDKMKMGSPIDLGLSHRESLDKTAKLRGDTGEGQRPTEMKGSMSSDRGSFPTKS